MSISNKIITKLFNIKTQSSKDFFEKMPVEVSEIDGVRSMHLGSITVQSSMRIDDPSYLELDYTQVMALSTLFLKSPKKMLLVGLGGGSMSKFFYKYFNKVKIIILELNPQVIQIAKHFFKLPKESLRFIITQGDGIQFIKNSETQYDLVLSDAFEEYGLPEEFCCASYFESCRATLSNQGLFVINLWGSDPKTPLYIDRIKSLFDNRVLYANSGNPGNVIVFAFNGLSEELRVDILRKKIKLLEKKINLNLMVYFNRLIKNNTQGTSNRFRFD